jgi:hypothetical protein
MASELEINLPSFSQQNLLGLPNPEDAKAHLMKAIFKHNLNIITQ